MQLKVLDDMMKRLASTQRNSLERLFQNTQGGGLSLLYTAAAHRRDCMGIQLTMTKVLLASCWLPDRERDTGEELRAFGGVTAPVGAIDEAAIEVGCEN